MMMKIIIFDILEANVFTLLKRNIFLRTNDMNAKL